MYETWPLEVREAVLDGRVEEGMTSEMVQVAWGQPTEVITRPNGKMEEEIWIYRKTTGGEYYDPVMSSMPIGSGPIYSARGIGRSAPVSVGVGTNVGGIGLGGGGIAPISSGPIMISPPVTTEKEVVFRDGIVHRADPPDPKK